MKNVWPKELIEAFYARISPPNVNGCRFWLGPISAKYGSFYHKKIYLAHKLALCIITNKPYLKRVETGLEAAHDCPGGDNKLCMVHLKWMTVKEHRADYVAKKQSCIGERNNKAKLKEEQVLKILEEYEAGVSRRELAAKYKVHKNTISFIVNGEHWKHLQKKKAG